jgi:hypothetical protein
MRYALLFFVACQSATHDTSPDDDTELNEDTGQADTDFGPCEVGPNNKRPTAVIQFPKDDQCFRSDQVPMFEAMLGDDGGLDCLEVSLESSEDGVLPLAATIDPFGLWSVPLALSNNQHTVTMKVVDGDGAHASKSIRINVNDKPTGLTVMITPDPVFEGEELSVVILTEPMDPEGDSLIYTYEWFCDGVLFNSGNNPEVPLNTVVTNEVWEVEVTPHDDCGPGEVGSEDITIQ